MIAIEVKNLYFAYYDEDYVLKDINLIIRKGERVAIMGENGAGKTTLIKHFNGLLKPKRGYVKIFGKDTRNFSVAELSRIVGIVFQNPEHQFFAETIEKEVAFALENFGFPKEEIKRRVENILKYFGLLRYKDKSPYSLSEGEKKRVAIASVLVYDPEIIVLDEPTTGQDAVQRKRIIDLMKKISSLGKTIIAVTHDIDFVIELFDRVIIMANGRIIADGPIKEILTNREVLSKARLLPSPITQCAWLLKELGVPQNILTPDEFVKSIIEVFQLEYKD